MGKMKPPLQTEGLGIFWGKGWCASGRTQISCIMLAGSMTWLLSSAGD